MADISITPAGEDTVRVAVGEGEAQTTHVVTVTDEARARYGGTATTEDLVEASFRFLLDREPKESILSRFDLPVIERYFPDYPEKIGDYL